LNIAFNLGALTDGLSRIPSPILYFLDCGWIFAQHFCNRLGPAYLALKNVLDEANPGHAEVMNQIKKRFREETFTRQGIMETIMAYPELVSIS
jgi:glutamate dehydrogenase